MKKLSIATLFMLALIISFVSFPSKEAKAQAVPDICIITTDGDVIFEATESLLKAGAKKDNLKFSGEPNGWNLTLYPGNELVHNAADNKNYFIIHTGLRFSDPTEFCILFYEGTNASGQQVTKYVTHQWVVIDHVINSNDSRVKSNFYGTSFNFLLSPQNFTFNR